MVDHASQIVEEILQIKAQYVAEVGKGRRVWPRSIKDRAAKLDELGVPAKALARQTGISYDTLILWRYNRRHARTGKFHELSVNTKVALPGSTAAIPNVAPILKSGTVTLPNSEMPSGTARLTTPNGFVIDGLDAAGVVWLISQFSRSSGGGYAS